MSRLHGHVGAQSNGQIPVAGQGIDARDTRPDVTGDLDGVEAEPTRTDHDEVLPFAEARTRRQRAPGRRDRVHGDRCLFPRHVTAKG